MMDFRTTFLPTVDGAPDLMGGRASGLRPSSDGRLIGSMRTAVTRLGILSVETGPASGNMPTDHVWPTVGDIARRETAAHQMTPGLLEQTDSIASAFETADQRVDILLATASHELASPLTALGGSLQLAERWLLRAHERADPDQQPPLAAITHLLDLANQQVGRMNRLVADLQDSAAIRAGKLQMRFAPANLMGIVVGVVAEQRLVHPRRVFSLELPECESVVVTVDADRIRQVLTNYLTNAVKYTAPGKPIEVGLYISNTGVRVSVRDQGPGLELAQQERIWERFHQIHTHDGETGASGLGLGLHICRVIVEQHHGRVGVESLPGQGATFWFELPLLRDGPAAEDYSHDNP